MLTAVLQNLGRTFDHMTGNVLGGLPLLLGDLSGVQSLSMGEQWEVEGEAMFLLKLAGVDAEIRPSPLRVARRLGLHVMTIHAGSLPGDAALARVWDEWRIYLRRNLRPEQAQFAIAHEIAEWHLRQQQTANVEDLADRIAAALLVPRRAFQRIARAPEWARLARRLRVTQPFAALRWGEVTLEPTAVVSPRGVRTRGAPWGWPPVAVLQQEARSHGEHVPPGYWVLRGGT